MCLFLVPKKLMQESVSRHPSFPSPPSVPHDPNVVGDSAPPDGTPSLTSDSVPGKKQSAIAGLTHIFSRNSDWNKTVSLVQIITFIRRMMRNTDLQNTSKNV